MTARRLALAALDRAERLNLVTLLRGIPRVGRTRLLSAWAGERPGVRQEAIATMLTSDASIQVFDRLRRADVPAFVEGYRRLEAEGRRVKLVVAPEDLGAMIDLERDLPGVAGVVELPPLQPDELPDIALGIEEAAGPILDAVPSDQPTNRPAFDPHRHWLRGGLPQSYNADTDQDSFDWRHGMMRGVLSRDYAEFKISPVLGVDEALTWIADRNGSELDVDKPPQGKKTDALSAITVLSHLGLIRVLPNYPAGTTASLAAMRKVYIRDSGLLHARLGIQTIGQLRASPKMGDSWEGYAMETLIIASDGQASCQFYRQEREDGHEGPDEIDLVLDFAQSGGPVVGIEFKVSPDKKPEDGYGRAMKRIGATQGFVVHSGEISNLDAQIHRLDLATARQRILAFAGRV